MIRHRYLIIPPSGFCAPFIVWAETRELALKYSGEWLNVTMPDNTLALRYIVVHPSPTRITVN